MNRHERRKARAQGVEWGAGRGEAPPGYEATANATLAVARAFLRKMGEPPRFALIDRKIALAVSLLDHGHTFARNPAAHELIDAWIVMTRELGLEDGPTYMMLRAVVELLELPHETATLDELFPGYELRTMSGQPAGKS
jgi:hypothetical protein